MINSSNSNHIQHLLQNVEALAAAVDADPLGQEALIYIYIYIHVYIYIYIYIYIIIVIIIVIVI